MVMSVVYLGMRLFGNTIPGLSTTHILLTLNLGFSAVGFGILGEYISKIYSETKRRPLWIIQDSIGVDIDGNELG